MVDEVAAMTDAGVHDDRPVGVPDQVAGPGTDSPCGAAECDRRQPHREAFSAAAGISSPRPTRWLGGVVVALRWVLEVVSVVGLGVVGNFVSP